MFKNKLKTIIYINIIFKKIKLIFFFFNLQIKLYIYKLYLEFNCLS